MPQQTTGRILPSTVIAATNITNDGPVSNGDDFLQTVTVYTFTGGGSPLAIDSATMIVRFNPIIPPNAIINSIECGFAAQGIDTDNSAMIMKLRATPNSGATAVTLEDINLTVQFDGSNDGEAPDLVNSPNHTFQGSFVNNSAVQGIANNSSTLEAEFAFIDPLAPAESAGLTVIAIPSSFGTPFVKIDYEFFPKKVTIINQGKVKLQSIGNTEVKAKLQ